MKKFRYKMENLLQVKIKLEDQEKIAYGNTRMRLSKEEETLAKLHERKAAYEDELRQLRSNRLDIVSIRRSEEAIKILEEKIQQQTLIVKNWEKRLEVARIRLNEAVQQRKIQEKLKEKAFEEYQKEYEAEEQKEIDQLNSYRYSNPMLNEED